MKLTAAEPLAMEFYTRDTVMVAKELLGKNLIRKYNGEELVCKIVETEAYYGRNDPASHAAGGPTARSAVMFGPPGRAYVYFNYGVHHLFNIVTEPDGQAGAVLIRALEPLDGVEIMMKNRPVDKVVNLTNGPGKLCQALGITLEENGQALFGEDLFICNGVGADFDIAAAPRIGISAGREELYRFYIKNNLYISRK